MPRDEQRNRLSDVQRFYALLEELEQVLGGVRLLSGCNGRMSWPGRGVYFFFEPGEARSTSGSGPRLVRIGTHALKSGGISTLWKRLSQHQGSMQNGGGNHRGSIFRLHVGTALINREHLSGPGVESWGRGGSTPADARRFELPIERMVSNYIRSMPFLWVSIEDAPGPDSLRGYIERNSIALLSNAHAGSDPIDPPSPDWLGHWAARDSIRRSGLWNVNHIDEGYSADFLNVFEKLISEMPPLTQKR